MMLRSSGKDKNKEIADIESFKGVEMLKSSVKWPCSVPSCGIETEVNMDVYAYFIR